MKNFERLQKVKFDSVKGEEGTEGEGSDQNPPIKPPQG